jgi:hypothetical protein
MGTVNGMARHALLDLLLEICIPRCLFGPGFGLAIRNIHRFNSPSRLVLLIFFPSVRKYTPLNIHFLHNHIGVYDIQFEGMYNTWFLAIITYGGFFYINTRCFVTRSEE